MRIRYVSGKKGIEKKAVVYTKEEHGINFKDVDSDAVYVTARLREAGFESYIVGGAVRDLILGKKPKDFDIASAANPAQIKRLFRFSRIIGKRFRLVHVSFGEKILEVATFRSIAEGTVGNVFGTVDDDVKRRDFTCNALFYEPEEQVVVDYVGGFEDIKERRLRNIIPLDVIFTEDPVRMIRAVKFAVQGNFTIPAPIQRKIKKQAPLLAEISASRLTEEIFKIINSSDAPAIIEALCDAGLYKWLQPEAAKLLRANPGFRKRYLERFALVSDGNALPRDIIGALYRDYIESQVDWKALSADNYEEVFKKARSFVLPMNPPRLEMERGVRRLFEENGIEISESLLHPRRGGVRHRFDVRPPAEKPAQTAENEANPAKTPDKSEKTAGAPPQTADSAAKPAKKRRKRRKKKAPPAT